MATRIPRIISSTRQPTTRAKTQPSLSRIFAPSWGTTTAHQAPRAPSAPATFSPTASSAASIGTPAPSIPQSDPRDAQYFNDVAKLDQYYQSNKANLGASAQELARNLTKNQGLLAEQQPKDELSAKQNANKAGLFYSGALGKNLGDIATSYARRRSDLQSAYESDTGNINRQLADLDVNYGPTGLLRNDVLQQGIARASEADQANAMALAASQQVQPAAAPASLPYRSEPGKSSKGVPGVWHIYPGGRKVFVAKR